MGIHTGGINTGEMMGSLLVHTCLLYGPVPVCCWYACWSMALLASGACTQHKVWRLCTAVRGMTVLDLAVFFCSAGVPEEAFPTQYCVLSSAAPQVPSEHESCPFAGVPEETFLHDVTDHIDYRGEE